MYTVCFIAGVIFMYTVCYIDARTFMYTVGTVGGIDGGSLYLYTA